ncbi:hypothetical protein FBU30_006683 [Linnemannia zychae]|nr:hypothetical protein FBU30_006683 [Linnemannia zychae]
MPFFTPRPLPIKSKFRASKGRPGYHHLLLALLTLHSLYSPTQLFSEASISCIYPNYKTQVKPGETAVLTWQVSGSDMSMYNSLSATLYCMDIDGPVGGIWRNIETLFQNKGLVGILNEVKFNVPDCGRLANDVAIRIVAYGQGSVSQNDACYFRMDPRIAEVPPPTTTATTRQPPPTTISKNPTIPPVTTANPSSSSLPPSSQLPPISTSISGSNPSATSTPSKPLSIFTTVSGTVVGVPYPSNKPYPPLPPLPPLPEAPVSSDSVNGSNDSGSSRTRTLLASICSAAALVIIVSLLVLRRRRNMRHSGRGINSGHGVKLPRLKLLHNRSKGDQKEGRFHLMHDNDDYDNPEMDREVAAAAGTASVTVTSKSQVTSSTDHPPLPALVDLSSESEKSGRYTCNSRDSNLSYPPSAHLDPSWRRSASYPFTYDDDEYTMSSMRSSCETSSVVREYWAASMAARAERRLEGYPPTIDYYDEGSVFGDQRRRTPSFSSMSRKAEIMTLDSGSSVESSVFPEADGFLKRQYRNTMNSVQSYIQRSMTMSLSSLRSTFTSSSEEESSCPGRSRGTGFRPPINSEFLNHLNIKSVRSEERQIEYYTHLYRQNSTMTMSTCNYGDYEAAGPRSSIMTGNDRSHRSSSVPSLTSTNDPFQTFDSNEILLDMNPFADQHAISATTLAEQNSDAVIGNGTENELLSTDTTPRNTGALCVTNNPTPSSSSTVSTAENINSISKLDDPSNSSLLGSFPIPPIAEPIRPSTASINSTTSSS